MSYRYGIIGTGRPHGSEGATGFGMAHTHYTNFMKTGRIDMVAFAEIRDDNAELFKERYSINPIRYVDYHEMLRNERLDLVSVTTWPHLHADMVVAAAEAGVKAILCEKPMATTWGDAKRMKAAADANGTMLAFNHQRRYMKLFETVQQLIKEGTIGELVQIQAETGDMADWGTHWLDLMFSYNEETPAEWVIGQIDSRAEKRIFGAYTEEQAICHFKWQNGVRGLLFTGYQSEMNATHRIIGTEGVIEVTRQVWKLRVLDKESAGWRYIDIHQEVNEHIQVAWEMVRALDEPGFKPRITADNAIHHTEVIFATFESSRRHGRVDLPLDVEDNALIAMAEQGIVGPDRKA